jgi:hypothetical protein
MGRTGLRLLSAFAAVALLLMTPPVRAAAPVDRIWFCPDPGTLDYIDLFTHPEEWPHARQLMDVFKVYQQHTQLPPPPLVGPNTFDALARAGAFRTLTRWGKKVAIEAGAVKEFYCTPDASGMSAAIGNTNDSIQRVEGVGATVSYIARDEPFVSGRSRVCGGPALEPTADRVATYVSGVTAARPKIRIGLIEAYPFSSATAIQTIIQLLKARNATPAFLHMDVDWHLSGSAAFKRDMAVLQGFCASENIPFGIIIVGYNGDADALYAVDVYGITELIVDTFSSWDHMPDHIIFQSWVVSSTGLLITPTALPEDRAYTHTQELWDVFRRLRGASGGAVGRAVPRR